MRTINVPQGSPAWRSARAGIATASCADKIIRPSDGKLSASFPKYMAFLLSEWFLGEPIEQYVSPHMIRGTELEAEARAWYSFESGYEVEQVGFCLNDVGDFGCSPDGLIGEDGGLELKNPGMSQHMLYLLDKGKSLVEDYRCQVQANLLVTGRPWWELASFSPVLPSIRMRIEPDPEFQAALAAALDQFNERMEACKRDLAPLKADRDRARAVALEAAMESDSTIF